MIRELMILLTLLITTAAPPLSTEKEPVASLGAPTLPVYVGQASIQWVIRTSDIAACASAAPELRALLREFRGQVNLSAYYVGDDTALVHSFLRRERLGSVTVQLITESQYQAEFAQRFSPVRTPFAVLEVTGAPDRAYYADMRAAAGRRAFNELTVALAGVLQPPVQGSTRVRPSTFNGGQ
jgi:hypothetical protein